VGSSPSSSSSSSSSSTSTCGEEGGSSRLSGYLPSSKTLRIFDWDGTLFRSPLPSKKRIDSFLIGKLMGKPAAGEKKRAD